MTSTLTRPADTATGTLAGHTAMFEPLHRAANTSPVAFTATVTLPLSFEDMVAALWVATAGMPFDEIDADPASQYSVFQMVLSTVVSFNDLVSDARYEIDKIRPGTDDHAALLTTRALVAATFSGLGEVA
jgi:hypothetical protein